MESRSLSLSRADRYIRMPGHAVAQHRLTTQSSRFGDDLVQQIRVTDGVGVREVSLARDNSSITADYAKFHILARLRA